MKMPQKELSKISGISQVQISFIENGLSEPMELTKQRLAEALGVPVETLFPAEIAMHALKACRVKKLMTQEELARISSISQVTISFIENGLSEPMELTKQRLAEALGVDLQTLFPRSR
ncbi:TPA: hypothetical protein DIV45_03325 [Patescibacteria group bacterium]|nr:hypothetical protein [Patescibacteria group bacterium]